jgi:hypothetical protein
MSTRRSQFPSATLQQIRKSTSAGQERPSARVTGISTKHQVWSAIPDSRSRVCKSNCRHTALILSRWSLLQLHLLISWTGEFVVLVPAAEELAPAGAFGTGSVGSRAVDAPRASTRAVWLCSLAYLADARSGPMSADGGWRKAHEGDPRVRRLTRVGNARRAGRRPVDRAASSGQDAFEGRAGLRRRLQPTEGTGRTSRDRWTPMYNCNSEESAIGFSLRIWVRARS